MRLIPNDQISERTEYSPPWIRSGFRNGQRHFEGEKEGETHTHISRRPHKRIRNTINQLPANPKITKFHLPLRIHEDIRGLDIPMDDPVFVVQVCEALEYCFGYTGEDPDGD